MDVTALDEPASGREPYGSVTVCVALSKDHGDSTVHVEVIDDGSDGSLPFVRAATTDSDSGRGLFMVELLSAR